MSLRSNMEFKARLVDLAAAREIARRCGEYQATERQTDTYFAAASGRLKLREIAGRGSWLIGYARGDDVSSRRSDYRLVEIADAVGVRETLTAALGVRATVRKVREIYLNRNVRIHLDCVEGLGEFLEFEAVLSGRDEEPEGRRQVEELIELFSATIGEPIAVGYADFLSGE